MFDYYLKGQVVDSKQTLMSEDQSVMGLLGARIVCRVDCANEMNDGTLMTGFVVTFNYEDGTTSKANAQGPWGQGGGASVYSLDKCVKWNKIQIGARRPSGIVEVINGQSQTQAPPGKCKTVEGWALRPARLVSEEHLQATESPMEACNTAE